MRTICRELGGLSLATASFILLLAIIDMEFVSYVVSTLTLLGGESEVGILMSYGNYSDTGVRALYYFHIFTV